MYIIGVDPGANGAIAVMTLPSRTVELTSLSKMTRLEIASYLSDYCGIPCRAYIEKVGVMHGQGIVSAGTFMENFGFLQGVLVALGIPMVLTPPKEWQKAVGLRYPTKSPYPERKRLGQKLSHQIFPSLATTLHTSDAVLIAEAGARLFLGT
jgi:hypothetical protein